MNSQSPREKENSERYQKLLIMSAARCIIKINTHYGALMQQERTKIETLFFSSFNLKASVRSAVEQRPTSKSMDDTPEDRHTFWTIHNVDPHVKRR